MGEEHVNTADGNNRLANAESIPEQIAQQLSKVGETADRHEQQIESLKDIMRRLDLLISSMSNQTLTR